MGVFDRYFPMGLGTTRFPIAGQQDTAGIDQSIQLVLCALEHGVNYVDVGYNYSAGMALLVLQRALRQVKKRPAVTAKVHYGEDKSADDARRRVEFYLRMLEQERVEFFTCWNIRGYNEFQMLMQKGGVYDSALRLKEEGLVQHICCSVHAKPEDTIRILNSGAFEGMTISYAPYKV